MSPNGCPRCGGLIPNDLTPSAYPGPMSRVDRGVELCSAFGWDEVMLLDEGAQFPRPAEWPVAITHPLPRRFEADPDPTLLARIGTTSGGGRRVSLHVVSRAAIVDAADYGTTTDERRGAVIDVHVADDHLDALVASGRRAGLDAPEANRRALDVVIGEAARRAGLTSVVPTT